MQVYEKMPVQFNF